MKDKILKLCRRMRNATKTDLLQIAEIEPNVLETVLMYLLDEKLLEEKNGCYFPIDKKELTEIPRIELRSLPLMIQCHSPETIDLIINRSSGHARNAQMLLDRYKLLGDVFKESVKSSKDDFAKLFLLCAQSNNWKKNVQENQEKIDGAKKMVADIIYKLQCNSLTALKTDYEDTVLDILKVSLGAKQSNIRELTTFAKYVGQSKENFLRIYRLLTYDSILKSFESDKMFQAAMWVLYLNI